MPEGAQRTRDQSASSSSASSMHSEVTTPWPISLLAITTVTVPSRAILTQPLKAISPSAVGRGSKSLGR